MNFYLIILLSLFNLSFGCSKHNICYYTSWTGVQPDPYLCTHVIYSFADMSNGQLSGVWSNPLSHLRNSNPSIKILLAVGGWNFGVSRMTEMLSTQETRQKFIDHAVTYLRQLDFDGLDLDYEYPGTNYPQYGRYSPPDDKQKFTLLCDGLRNAFENEAIISGKQRLLLTVAFGCRKLDIDLGYEIDKLGKSLDYFNLMTYDLRGGFDSIASHHSALYAGNYEINDDRVYNIDWVVNYYLANGAPKEKLILGLASYGKSFRWTTNDYKLGSTATFSDWFSYQSVCSLVKSGWRREWIVEQSVPVAIKGDTIIGYDDIESIRLKAEYALKRGLGGVMWWSLDHDDPSGSCGEGRFPLINEVNKVFQNTECSLGDTDPHIIEFNCTLSETKLVRHPTNCSKFIICSDSREITCPSGLLFSFTKQNCDFAQNVNCSIIQSSTQITTTTVTTQIIDKEYDCSDGTTKFVKYQNDCNKFIRCSTQQILACPNNLFFSFEKQLCDYPENVSC